MLSPDDEYEGYFIPKDSMIFLPIWAMHHDPDQYADPSEFNPDRYLNHPKLAPEYAVSPDFENRDKYCITLSSFPTNMTSGSPHHYGYGAGRRMCPGLHLAERNMWRIVSKLLWAFDIFEPTDEATGEKIPLDANAFSSAILMCPLPFKVRVIPRSKVHMAMVEKELSNAQEIMSAWE